MQAEIKGGQAFSYVDVDLEPGDIITTESNAMSSMDANIELRSRFNGGFLIGLLRKFLGGETLFINDFSNPTAQTRRLTIVQPTPGEIRSIELDNSTLYLQPGAFLACTPGVKIGIRFAGFISWIAREGLFRIAVSGTGKVWYGAFGALLEKEIDGEYIVDTSHLVSYEPGIKLKLQLAGGIFSSLFGGEGLVTRVVGKGKIVIQTRSIPGITSWLNQRF